MTVEQLLSIDKDAIPEAAKMLSKEDVEQLVHWLAEKDDKIRYPSFLLLTSRCEYADDVYPYWDIFCSKLKSANSFQRNIGLLMIAGNAKWDRENKMDGVLTSYLSLLNDEKPITVRMCIQGLCKIVPYKKHLHNEIINTLKAVNLLAQRETMQKLVAQDIQHVLSLIS